MSERQEVEVSAAAGERPIVCAMSIENGLQRVDDGGVVVEYWTFGGDPGGLPSLDCGEDVVGEVVDESQRPGHQRAVHLFRDAVGRVFGGPLSVVVSAVIEVSGIEE